jgi:uncharacterized protein (DUF1501 family)
MLSRRKFLNLATSDIVGNVEDKQENVQVSINKSSSGADILVYIFQRGAADGLNLVVPYGDPDYAPNRPTLAIPDPGMGAGAAINLNGFFGLNPNLSALMPMFDSGDLAMIHACGSLDQTHSHFQTQAFIDRGTTDLDFSSGWLARYANANIDLTSTAFQSVAMSSAIPASLSLAQKVVALSSIAGFEIQAPASEVDLISAQLQNLFSHEQSLDDTAQATFSALDNIADLNTDNFPVENGAVYPNSPFARKLQDLAILIKSGIGVETASVDIGGWDTHGEEATTLPVLAKDYADSVAAFYIDLGTRMADISIITLTEFGRRVAENGSGGTDHGTGSVMFVLGGGVNGEEVYTTIWPGLSEGALVGPGDLQITTDYRTVISELMERRMFYTDTANLFPGFAVPDFLGIFEAKIVP